jgi:dihydrofolate reductase
MKTTIYIGTSLDGFIARTNGDLDWLMNPENHSNEVFEGYNDFIGKIDAIVIGRGTYEKVLTFPAWPYEKKVFLLSTSLKQLPKNLEGKAAIISMKPKKLLDYLSNGGFTNIYVDGGKVIQEFLKEDCIDEMIITKVPVLIGNGIPLFGILNNDLLFEHIETKVYSNGLVRSHYKRKRK